MQMFVLSLDIECEGSIVYGVFSSRQKAEDFKKLHQLQDHPDSKYVITQYEVDV